MLSRDYRAQTSEVPDGTKEEEFRAMTDQVLWLLTYDLLCQVVHG